MENKNFLKTKRGKLMKTKISTFLKLPIVIAAACVLVAGCMSVNDKRFERELRTWVPVGTPAEEASRTMSKHGFKCALEGFSSRNPSGKPAVVCKRKNR